MKCIYKHIIYNIYININSYIHMYIYKCYICTQIKKFLRRKMFPIVPSPSHSIPTLLGIASWLEFLC